MSYRYPVVITRDSDGTGFGVKFPDFPEAFTFGSSVEIALAQAIDCLDEAIASRMEESEEVPVPSRVRKYAVEPTLTIAAKAALYQAVQESGIKKTALARHLVLNENEVRRMLDPRHPTKLGRIQEALAALGKRLSLTVVDLTHQS